MALSMLGTSRTCFGSATNFLVSPYLGLRNPSCGVVNRHFIERFACAIHLARIHTSISTHAKIRNSTILIHTGQPVQQESK